MTTPRDAETLAHRALASATLYGLLPPAARVVFARPPEVSPRGAAGGLFDGRGVAGADLVVTIDGGHLDEAAFGATPPHGAVAVMIGSTSAVHLVAAGIAPDRTRRSAFTRALAWAEHRRGPVAPAVSPERVRELVARAGAAGLALVEPDLALLRGATSRAPVDRAILATIALGATARPLLFVREARAPKGGLARLRDDRALDGWVEGLAPPPGAAPTSLVEAALDVLIEGSGPTRGKDLLREARSRWADAARALGVRAAPSASDGQALARGLVAAWLEGSIELYARDPAAPLVAG